VPYFIDLDRFCVNGTYSYTPGETYTGLSVHAENDMPQLRGVLIQSRPMADDNNMVGTFAVNADSAADTQLSNCNPRNVGITHSNRNDKNSVYFDWTAPASGTGPLRFGYAVVQTQPMYWANQRTAVIGEDGVGGDACGMATDATTAGSSQLTSVGFPALLMVALAVAIKVAL